MSQDSVSEDYPSARYAWYVVAVLTVAYIFSFIDRQIISLLVAPIQRDLQISDTQMSLLMGLSFAVFYTLFGIPLGRLADTHSRRAIISLGIAFWSLMTAGCGLTRNFWELALMRMGVGVGEATLSPAAYSLIADYFPPHRRSTAMSVYSMGIYLGSGLAFILGGMVAQFVMVHENYTIPLPYVSPGPMDVDSTVSPAFTVRSWQLVFFVVGLPGLLVALLLLTVREPRRRGIAPSGQAVATVGETLAYVLANRTTFVCLNLGVALVTLNAYASSSWVPSLFIRRFQWTQGQTGLAYGTIIALFGTLGVVCGGWLADRWFQQGRMDAPLRVAWMSCLCWLPFGALYPLMPTGTLTAGLMIPVVFFSSMPFGVAPAAIQRMMPNTMRAQATAIYLFVINIIGMGSGPTIAALLTERVFQDKSMLHYSLLIVGIGSYLLAVLLLGLSLKSYRRSLDYLQQWTQAQTNGR